ncbi:hypothetical protein GCM10009788_42610 [Nocardioides humi]|uniref:Calcineurin-like phosphoesterase n=2 Tax=Nocardioides humi TaxID=449461 RepID=A0ABN2B9H7_9ACTN
MKSKNPAPARGTLRRRVASGVTIAALSVSAVLGAGALDAAHAEDPAAITGIVLSVGGSENQRVVSWYASANTAQSVQVAPTSALVNGEFPTTATTYSATVAANTVSGGYNGHATLSGLQEHTAYSYRVGAEGAWSPTYSFKTQDFEGDFDFLFFGDPQIGASGNVANDTAGWAATLDVATAAHPDVELFVSGGDQVETAGTESQWNAFLSPDKLRQYPWVPTIGNHDVGSKAYEQHFWTPNTDRSAALYTNPSTASGGDYWFIYKDVLFIDINSNAYNNGADAAHVNYITSVVNAHGAEAKYTVLVYHHAIYSPASHAQDADAKIRRQDFPTAFSNLGVDLVLQGHDHAYSRSYLLKNGEKANADEAAGANEVFQGPGGVVYVTGNSASGSKYYGITAPGSYADPAHPSQRWYNSVENQENRRSYVKVSVGRDALTVEDIRSEASANGAVGSTIDKVVIKPNHGDGQEVAVDVPQAGPGEFGWKIDGRNKLVDLGEAEEQTGFFLADGAINPLTVTDTRPSASPWAISGQISDFADGTKSFAAKYLGWQPHVLAEGVGATAGAPIESGYTAGNGLADSRTLSSATTGHPLGSADLGADLTLKLPTSVPKGSYRATLTITAVS